MARRKDAQKRGSSRSTFESNLISGLLKERTTKATKNSGMPPMVTPAVRKSSSSCFKQPPASPYTDAKGAAAYLSISKAKFFRLRRQGYFKPSPITGRYHTDDLDRETRGLSARDAQGTCLSQQISTPVGTPPQAGFWPGAVPTSEAFEMEKPKNG
jgi:hypothetical protein